MGGHYAKECFEIEGHQGKVKGHRDNYLDGSSNLNPAPPPKYAFTFLKKKVFFVCVIFCDTSNGNSKRDPPILGFESYDPLDMFVPYPTQKQKWQPLMDLQF